MNPETIVLLNQDGTERTMEYAAFEAMLNAKLRNVVSSEGSIVAKCTSATSFVDDDGNERIILNFQAISADQVSLIKQALEEGDYQAALNVGLAQSVRPNATFIPQKGESVKLSIGTVRDREDTKDLLRIVGMSPLPKAATKKLSLAELMGGTASPSTEPDFDVTTANKDALLAKAQEMGINVAPHMTSAGAIKTTAVETVRALVAAQL